MNNITSSLARALLAITSLIKAEQPLPEREVTAAIEQVAVADKADLVSLLKRLHEIAITGSQPAIPVKEALTVDKLATITPSGIKHALSGNGSSYVLETNEGQVKVFVMFNNASDLRTNPDAITQIAFSRSDNSQAPLKLIKSRVLLEAGGAEKWDAAMKFYRDHLQVVEPTTIV